MSETTGRKRTDRIKLESICNDEESMGFYASFEDGLSIQYEPAGRLSHSTKRTLWINADPDEVCIAFLMISLSRDLTQRMKQESGCLIGAVT